MERTGEIEDSEGLSLGTLLRGCRVEAGLTQETLAERSGLSARGIRAIELGSH